MVRRERQTTCVCFPPSYRRPSGTEYVTPCSGWDSLIGMVALCHKPRLARVPHSLLAPLPLLAAFQNTFTDPDLSPTISLRGRV